MILVALAVFSMHHLEYARVKYTYRVQPAFALFRTFKPPPPKVMHTVVLIVGVSRSCAGLVYRLDCCLELATWMKIDY